MQTQDFTLTEYQSLIAKFLALGYQIADFQTAEPENPHLILRHDIDMSLPAALTIAEAESAAGVRSIFFVLIRSEFYNPHTPAALHVIRRIVALGHEIGLHFDAGLYGDQLDTLDKAASAECGVLEALAGQKVRTISFHRPASALLGLARPLAGRRHAYEPRFFREMAYSSDSQGRWAHGHPLGLPAVHAKRALQLLTHPVWWTTTADEAPPQRLRRLLRERMKFLDGELAAHCRIHVPEAPES